MPSNATTIVDTNTADTLDDRAAELVDAARAFHAAAGRPGSCAGISDALASSEEALKVLSAAWYQLAGDASAGIVVRRRTRGSQPPAPLQAGGLSREREAGLMGTLHDVAAAFARCARVCRDGRSTVVPITTRRPAAGRTDDQRLSPAAEHAAIRGDRAPW
ncbi:MAG: hypothetical protein ACRDLD_05915 [Thermoleophilaceae bacterium]